MSKLINMHRTKAMIERHEGREKYPYTDTTGHVTIGVGWNLTHNGLPDAMIEELFNRAYAGAVNSALQYPWFKQLNNARKTVIIDMMYNLGKNGFGSFERMIHALAHHAYGVAATEMLDSLWARQTGRRAQELAHQMLTGEWLDD